jgi:PAS domain S-box-containing protein
MRWSAERAIAAGFTVALVILIIVGVASYRNAMDLRDASNFEQHTQQILDDLRDVMSSLKDVETGSRGYALTGETPFLGPYFIAVPRARNSINRLLAEVRDPEVRTAILQLDSLVEEKIRISDEQVQLRRSGHNHPNTQRQLLIRGRVIMDRIRETSGRLQVQQFRALQDRILATQNAQRSVSLILQIGSTCAVLFLAFAMYVIFKDLRERRLLERSAERLRRQTQLILESAGEGIIGIGAHYHISFINPAAERLLGYGPGELAGRDVFVALHPTRPDGTPVPQNETPIFHALTEGSQRTSAEGTFWRKDGTSFPAQYTGAPIRGTDSDIIGAVITFQDVTRRREIDRMKDEFISVVSHELRTPLTSIRGALGLLAGGKVGVFPDKAQRMLDIAVNNTDRLVRLINDILDIERIDSGRVTMQKREVEIGDLMTQALEVMRPMADKNGVALELRPVNATVLADSDRMIQTFTNLLSNAIKFSPASGTVTFVGRIESDHVHITVADQGRGIPPDKLHSIFERFQQVDASDSREKGGTGLGLAICRSIVQQHGGEIWAESKLGEGSTFHVSLPLAETAAPHETDHARGATVLLCDDDAAVREVVGHLLEDRGFHVRAVGSGAEAIRSAQAEPPELIVLDLLMPSMNGWQVVDNLKANPATAHIPVVIFSVVRPDGNQGGNGSVAGWVTKPLEESQFFRTLSQALGGRAAKTRVLIVEDDPELSRLIESMLRSDGIDTRIARSGREAIQVLPEYRPDLLVLDVVLPLGDGFSVVHWMRHSEKFRDLPVMVYSGRELSSEERARLTLGRTQFFTKNATPPNDFEQHVLALLAQVLPDPSPVAEKGENG